MLAKCTAQHREQTLGTPYHRKTMALSNGKASPCDQPLISLLKVVQVFAPFKSVAKTSALFDQHLGLCKQVRIWDFYRDLQTLHWHSRFNRVSRCRCLPLWRGNFQGRGAGPHFQGLHCQLLMLAGVWRSPVEDDGELWFIICILQLHNGCVEDLGLGLETV